MDTRRATDLPAKLADRARHIWRLRRHVVAVSLACFVLFFGVMTIRLSLGDDPALGSATDASAAAGATNPRERIEESSLFGEEDQQFEPEGGQIEPEAVHSGQS
jgi:hypothetical protein